MTRGEELQERYMQLKALCEEVNQKVTAEQGAKGLFEKLEEADSAAEENKIMDQLVAIEKKHNSQQLNKEKIEVEKELINWFLDSMEELQEKGIEIDGVKVESDIDIDEIRENLFFPTTRKKLRNLALKTDPQELAQRN